MSALKILCVDDDAPVLRALQRLLRRSGFEVETAPGGRGALQKLEHFAADIVLSDFRMPGMTGAELLEAVRALHPRALRVIISGYADLDSIAPDLGARRCWHVIAKPWDGDALPGQLRALAAERGPARGASP